MRRIHVFSAAAAALLLAGAAPCLVAQDGLYFSFGSGLAQGAASSLALTGRNHPTRCDRLLYADPASAPTDGDCATPSDLNGLYSFDPDAGISGSVAAGFASGSLAIELEWLQRSQRTGPALLTLGDGSGTAITGKDTEWSDITPPFGEILDHQAQQLTANIRHSLPGMGRIRPYAGVGAGIARLEFQWYNAFVRKSIAGGYLEAFGGSAAKPDAAPEWQRAAAGTISDLTLLVSETAPVYQLFGGFEWALGPSSVLDLRARYVVGPEFEEHDVVWDQIRSHVPVQADGVTPFTSDLAFPGMGFRGIGASLKYRPSPPGP